MPEYQKMQCTEGQSKQSNSTWVSCNYDSFSFKLHDSPIQCMHVVWCMYNKWPLVSEFCGLHWTPLWFAQCKQQNSSWSQVIHAYMHIYLVYIIQLILKWISFLDVLAILKLSISKKMSMQSQEVCFTRSLQPHETAYLNSTKPHAWHSMELQKLIFPAFAISDLTLVQGNVKYTDQGNISLPHQIFH